MSTTDNDWITLKDGDVMLKIIEESKDGDDAQPVKSGDTVLIEFTGYLTKTPEPPTASGGEVDLKEAPIFQNVKNWLVLIGDSDIQDCLEIGIKNMKAGQKGYIWSNYKFSFSKGCKRTYKKDDKSTPVVVDGSLDKQMNGVIYDMKVLQIVKDTSQLNPYFTIQKALTKKNIANDLYNYEWPHQYQKILKLYGKAAKDMDKLLFEGTYFKNIAEPDNPQKKQVHDLMVDSYNNIIATHMRAKLYKKALESTETLLKKDSKNLKALLRKVKISILQYKKQLQEQSATAEADEENSDENKKPKKKQTFTISKEDVEEAIKGAENVIVYKDHQEEAELKKLRAQFKQLLKQEGKDEKE